MFYCFSKKGGLVVNMDFSLCVTDFFVGGFWTLKKIIVKGRGAFL